MSVDLCGVELGGRVVNGSGTFDPIAARRAFGDELLERFPFAAFVSKTITLAPRAGNPPPRLWETPAGLINSIGLPGKGVAGFLEQDLPLLAELPVPLVVSVMGSTLGELQRLVQEVGARAEVSLIELNLSCPNVKSGLIMGADPDEAARAVDRLSTVAEKPLIAKLTPNATDPGAVAAAAERAGAAAVSLINTLRATAFDPLTGHPWLGAGSGGLSGAAVRPIALAQVAAVAARTEIPIIGMGGIETGGHALDFLRAGAAFVGVGTENFRDPAAGLRIAAEIDAVSRNERAFSHPGMAP